MDFLIHLAIIAAGIFWLILLVAAFRATLLWTLVLLGGFVGSDAGFLGTCVGLAVGGAGYGALRLAAYVVCTVWRAANDALTAPVATTSAPRAVDRNSLFVLSAMAAAGSAGLLIVITQLPRLLRDDIEQTLAAIGGLTLLVMAGVLFVAAWSAPKSEAAKQ